MFYAFILGSHPELSIAEIRVVLPTLKVVNQNKEVLILEHQPLNAEKILDRLGGTIKIGQVQLCFHALVHGSIINLLKIKGNKKIIFGFSLYGNEDKDKFKKLGLAIKKELKNHGHRVRLVEAREKNLSSVIVAQEKLLEQGADILIIKINQQLYLGKTLAVQKFKEYSRRDYGRPERDMHVGLLPLKIAKIMINLAQPKINDVILDPFCGSGTILQEALLLGYKNVIGSDIDPQAIERTKKNLAWLDLSAKLFIADARKISQHLKRADCIISEVHLGPSKFETQMQMIISDLHRFYAEVFQEFKGLKVKKSVIAFPAWRIKNRIIKLPIEETLKGLGYQITGRFIYGRPDAQVLREIYVLLHYYK